MTVVVVLTLTCVVMGYLTGTMYFPRVDWKYVDQMTDDEIQEYVIRQAREAYAVGKIDLPRLEADVEALLSGKTPIMRNGDPYYYDPRVLDR